MGVKIGLFAIVLFALFIGQGSAPRSAVAIAPDEFHDVLQALVVRARETLYAIFVLQAITGFGTVLIALPVFSVLGYPASFSQGLLAGLLQFAPIVGPSVLVGGIAVFHLSMGELVAAVLVIAVAGTLVAWLPDFLIRPRFTRRTAHLPGSLYFIGFTGGVFSLGPIGIVAGPLVVALFAESISLLADHRRKEAGEQESALRLDDVGEPEDVVPQGSSAGSNDGEDQGEDESRNPGGENG